MIKLLGEKSVFAAFLFCYCLLIFIYPNYLSISYYEATIFYFDSGYLGTITRFFCNIFGQNDYGLRSFFIFTFFASLILFYRVSLDVVKRIEDARLATILFCLLPASGLSALLVMKSSVVIFMTLLFIYLHKRGRSWLSFAVLALSSVLDGAFAILFLSLIFYAVHKKDNWLIIVSIAFFGISMTIFGFDTGGKPQSFFLDTLGIYLLIFSPFLFFYFVFAIYKIKPEDRPIGWYISFWALVFSLILSFRQKIMLYDFAAFVVLAIPFMVRTFFASYRIRIGKNKRVYKIGFIVLVSSLFLSFLISFFNRPLYMLIDDKSKHFAYKYHVAKELALKLKSIGATECTVLDQEMALRLRFYGISRGSDYIVSQRPLKNSKKVSIVYSNSKVADFYVTKVNTF